MAKQEKEQANLIRIMSTDINADASLLYGLSKITGIGIMFANAVCVALKLDKNAKISSLSEKDIAKLEDFLSNPEKKGMPSWLFNQRKDMTTGNDLHLTSKEIEFNLIQLKRSASKLKSYKGLRYRAKLPVRGQRTKSNFRRTKTFAAMKAKSTGDKK
ncbi:MAG: 30S ribosomal protein S13 [Nanoarchaeota archaeon]|nr:30S ribosomal protein S13 [Nanoarchaeota archaeon]